MKRELLFKNRTISLALVNAGNILIVLMSALQALAASLMETMRNANSCCERKRGLIHMRSVQKRCWFISALMLILVSTPLCKAMATTNQWYPGGSVFTGWPTNWAAVSSLNDPDDGAIEQLDFVGDAQNPGAFWSSDTNYFFIRMRVDIGSVTTTTFSDAHWIYIDRVGFVNGTAGANMPDYALAWDSKGTPVIDHGLELNTGKDFSAVSSWNKVSLADIDGNAAKKIAPPDFNLTGDGYIRTIDQQPTVNFGNTTFIDFAVKWSYISANSALNTNQQWRLQFGSRNNSTDHNAPADDVAGGLTPASAVTYSDPIDSSSLSSAIDLTVYTSANGVMIELSTVNESGADDIVIYAWINNAWVEVGRVPSSQIAGEGSHCYTVLASGLAGGESYLFRIIDEAGHTHITAQPVTVDSIRMSAAVRLDLQTFKVTFSTEYGRSYLVKGSTDMVNWTTEYVSCPTASGWSGPSNTPFMAGPGNETEVLVSVNGREQAFFKIQMVRELP